MTAQLDRLEALLERVQENRRQPRGSAEAPVQQQRALPPPVYQGAQPAVVQPAALQPPALQPPALQPAGFQPPALQSAPLQSAAPASSSAYAERPAQPRAAETRGGKSAATPLEMAVEGRLSAPAQMTPGPSFGHAPSQSHSHAPSQARAQAAAPASHEGVLLVDAQAPQPTRPIAQVVSMNPPSLAATFGELLRRSLSLRPR